MKNRQPSDAVDFMVTMSILHGYPTTWDLLQEMFTKQMYELKALYVGEKAFLYKKARRFSPLFWFQIILTTVCIVLISPFLTAWLFVRNTIQELRGGYTPAKERWEVNFVKNNAKPPLDFQI